jgi:signal transduction histidine kinase
MTGEINEAQRSDQSADVAEENARGRSADLSADDRVAMADDAKHADALPDSEQVSERIDETLEALVEKRTAALTARLETLQKAARDYQQVESALRQSQKMEAVGQLTGGIAHTLNNILAGISGSLELIRIRTAQGRVGELERYIETSLTAIGRAAALTHRLLAFSRRQTLDPKPTNINRLVLSMEELFRNTVGPSIKVETGLTAELWFTLCDPNQLESSLLNLVLNSRDAMPDGGVLMIETANPVLGDRRGATGDGPDLPPGDYVALIVTDTGLGMSAEVLEKAFDPFFTTKPLAHGTGLGLSMVYGFVQQSGGQVLIRSIPGQGTTVTIYLPRHVEVADHAIERFLGVPVSAGAVPGAVVLVVEDEPDVRMIVVDVLEEIGCTVLEAGDGDSGLSILTSGTRVDLLVSDIGLPGSMNGRNLLRPRGSSDLT